MKFQIEELKFNNEGLIPVIIQDVDTLEVLMMAYMNKDSLQKTLMDCKTHFWSRSRKKLWLKGETSGHLQYVKNVFYDCDKDTILMKVKQVGGACHDGYKSCFYTEIIENNLKIIGEKVFDPKDKYKAK